MKAMRAMLRGVGPLAVLQLLADGEQAGYDLAQALACGRPDLLPVGEGATYALLYHLESRRLIASRLDDATPHAEPLYRLTERGRRRLTRATMCCAVLCRTTGEKRDG